MSLQEKLNDDLKRSMKEKLEPGLSTLRMIKSDIQYELTKTGGSSISDEAVLQIIKKNIAKRRDTALEYRKASRIDLAEKEEQEANFFTGLSPPYGSRVRNSGIGNQNNSRVGCKVSIRNGKGYGKSYGRAKRKKCGWISCFQSGEKESHPKLISIGISKRFR